MEMNRGRCPRCGGSFIWEDGALQCLLCSRTYRMNPDGVVEQAAAPLTERERIRAFLEAIADQR